MLHFKIKSRYYVFANGYGGLVLKSLGYVDEEEKDSNNIRVVPTSRCSRIEQEEKSIMVLYWFKCKS